MLKLVAKNKAECFNLKYPTPSNKRRGELNYEPLKGFSIPPYKLRRGFQRELPLAVREKEGVIGGEKTLL